MTAERATDAQHADWHPAPETHPRRTTVERHLRVVPPGEKPQIDTTEANPNVSARLLEIIRLAQRDASAEVRVDKSGLLVVPGGAKLNYYQRKRLADCNGAIAELLNHHKISFPAELGVDHDKIYFKNDDEEEAERKNKNR